MAECMAFMQLNMLLSLSLFIVSIIIPLSHFFNKTFNASSLPVIMLKSALFFNVGCLFITGCAGQLLYGPAIAACLGWSWSPFQYELAFSELALALIGLISPLFHKEFWLATVIAAATWLVGGTAVHIYYLFIEGNQSILNASFVMYWNVFIALWIIGWYIAARSQFQKQNIHMLCL